MKFKRKLKDNDIIYKPVLMLYKQIKKINKIQLNYLNKINKVKKTDEEKTNEI